MNKPKLERSRMTRDVLISRLEYFVRGGYKDTEEKHDLLREALVHLRRASLPDNPPCYVPEKDNPYPLCVGRGLDCCAECQLRGDWEPDDPYGVEGKASLDNKALTVEELREMDGDPVWVVAHPDWGHWELSECAEDYFEDRDEDFYGMTMPPTLPDPMGRYGLHMMGWLAYRRPPEKGE